MWPQFHNFFIERERSLKKRRKAEEVLLLTSVLSYDIIIEITKFIEKLHDYLNLAKVNKATYQLMMKENIHSLNEIFNHSTITINYQVPYHLCNILQNLNIKSARNIFYLENCTSLRKLNIDGDYINIMLTDVAIKNLINLEELSVHYSKIIGTCFTNLKKLKTLQLRNVDCITDEYFFELQNLTKLEIMGCRNVTGKCLQNLSQLTSLTFKYNNVMDENILNNFINLKELKIAKNKSSTFLQNLRNLEILKIDFLEDEDLINLKKLKSLTIFYNDNTSFTGKGFMYLTNLENLDVDTIIKISFNCDNLKYLLNLKNLRLTFNKINGICFIYLLKLELISVKLNNEFKEEYLKNLFNLKTLVITRGLSFKGKYLNCLQSLTELRIFDTNIKDKYLNKLTNLKFLALCKCENITGECLLNLTNLTGLCLITTNIFEIYLVNLPNLKELSITHCPNIRIGVFLLNMCKLKSLKYELTFEGETINEIKLFINQRRGTLFDYYKLKEMENHNRSFSSLGETIAFHLYRGQSL
ncbi:hypothetical protein ABK040_016377 [Willaertia magna]